MKKTGAYKVLLLMLAAVLVMAGCSAEPEVVVMDVTAAPQETPTPQPTPEPTPEITPEPTPTPIPENISPLTGLELTGEYKPMGVMIENTNKARPLSGVSQADVVYECLMEGSSVTRLFAIFNGNLPEAVKVGPVRSCRVYFVDIQQDWECGLIHFGGPDVDHPCGVYQKMAKVDLPLHVDGLGGKYSGKFWRSTDRSAPHNAYIDLNSVVENMPEAEKIYHFNFDAAYVPDGDSAAKLSIKYSGSYTPSYEYDAQTGNYNRFIGSDKMTDKEGGEQVSVKNIIVQYVQHGKFDTKEGHLDLNMYGTGKAEFFVDGKHMSGTWQRSQGGKTEYLLENGEKLTLKPGTTWVQMVRSDMEINWE